LIHLEEDARKDLRASAAHIRRVYLKKSSGNNVAVADVNLSIDDVDHRFYVGATSKGGRKSPIPKPQRKSEGGYFEPFTDPRTGNPSDTDAEYKVLSAIAETLDIFYDCEVKGRLSLYTELQPCMSCNGVLDQFKDRFPNINVHVFWDIPYPRKS
jgi:hypothetical protein